MCDENDQDDRAILFANVADESVVTDTQLPIPAKLGLVGLCPLSRITVFRQFLVEEISDSALDGPGEIQEFLGCILVPFNPQGPRLS